MNMEARELRKQYPDLVGGESIVGDKKSFLISDLIPIGLVVILFGWIGWFYGHVKPQKKLDELNNKIEMVSYHFDQRTSMIKDLIVQIRADVAKRKEQKEILDAQKAEGKKVNEDEFDRIWGMTMGNFQQLDKTRMEQVAQHEIALNELINSKPSEYAIQQRFEAMIEFAQMSGDIIDGRKLSQYYDSDFSVEQIDSEQNEDSGEAVFQIEELNIGSETDELIEQAQRAIRVAESYMDELTDDEKKAKKLMGIFEGFTLPKRKLELKEAILKEWLDKYKQLLTLWKELKVTQSLRMNQFSAHMNETDWEKAKEDYRERIWEPEQAKREAAKRKLSEADSQRRAKFDAEQAERKRKSEAQAAKARQEHQKFMDEQKRKRDEYQRQQQERKEKEEALRRKKEEARKKIDID